MSEDVKTLMEMGFSQAKSEKALAVTNYKGVEPAMEWLLAHVDDNEPTESPDNTSGAEAGEVSTPAEGEDIPIESSEGAQAKSLKCDECQRLFKSTLEMEYHAAKSGHSSFSESTEEKKPLTDEEKKEQLAKLEERMRQKRKEREEKEKEESREREKMRIRSGKDMLEAKKKMEDLEMLKIMEQRKREKLEDQKAKDRVRAQIEADKAARRAKAVGSNDVSPTPQPVSPPPVVNAISKDYSQTRLQIRLPDGTALTQTFGAKEQLSAVRLYIEMNRTALDTSFALMTSFPRKVFTLEDYEKPLDVLGLVPSAVVIVTKGQI